jgi:hypothetical protein
MPSGTIASATVKLDKDPAWSSRDSIFGCGSSLGLTPHKDAPKMIPVDLL